MRLRTIEVIATLALGLAVHRDYGISWDEPHQRLTGAVTVKHLAELFAPSLVSGEASRLPALKDYVDRDHGTAFEAPAVALEALLGFSDKRDIFMFRHLLTFLVCFVGAIAVYRLAERRFADADKQRARIKADPVREVVREQSRVKRAKKEKSDA